MAVSMLSSLVAKLDTGGQGACLLVGTRLEDGTLLAVDTINPPAGDSSVPGFDAIIAMRTLLPYGLSFVGVWSPDTPAAAEKLLTAHAALLGDASAPLMVATGAPAVARITSQFQLQKGPGGGGGACVTLDDSGGGHALAWLTLAGLQPVRVRACLSLTVHGGVTAAPVATAIEALVDEVCGEGVVFVLSGGGGGGASSSPVGAASGGAHVPPRFLAGPASSSSSSSGRGGGGACLSDVAAAGGDGGDGGHGGRAPGWPVDAAPMRLAPGTAAAAPTFEYDAVPSSAPVTESRVALELDALTYAPARAPLARLARDWLGPALAAQLRAAGAAILVVAAAHSAKPALAAAPGLRALRSCHFLPPGRAHHVCVLYPRLEAGEEADVVALAPYRRQLHTLLGLPLDRPALRPATRLTWAAAAAAGEGKQVRLPSVHVGLPLPGDAADSIHLVQGAYEYHHYMQDRFDDAGWGCAYRSLQTLCSWFRLQQYTAKPSPGHRDIQATLVRLGDKDKSFIGSSKWIGAIELSYVLDDYLGVSCKVVTINKGSDIPSHARELAAHFRTQGTPVMIGGGVLAYTLLGVYFNETTGDCAFLILDPHYTGGEDLTKIHRGTWVGWKRPGDSAAAGGPLFVNDAFYNFLCPQRPKEV